MDCTSKYLTEYLKISNVIADATNTDEIEIKALFAHLNISVGYVNQIYASECNWKKKIYLSISHVYVNIFICINCIKLKLVFGTIEW